MKDWDNLSESEKEKLAFSAIRDLADMLEGENDTYKLILLKTIFEYLYNPEELNKQEEK